MTPEGVKTKKSDRQVALDWGDVHLEIGIVSLSDIGQRVETIKRYNSLTSQNRWCLSVTHLWKRLPARAPKTGKGNTMR